MAKLSRVVLGLGCNLGDRLDFLRQALAKLAALPEINLQSVSMVYRSEAELSPGMPKDWDRFFLNLAALITTELAPLQLLHQLKLVEEEMGRPKEHPVWSPRSLDVDILLWEGSTFENDQLTIPHARLLTRPFALWPAAELVPEWLCQVGDKVDSVATWARQWGSKWDGLAPFSTRCTMLRAWGVEFMGVLNLTPNSFSDGGSYQSCEQAWQQVQRLCWAGSTVVDVGAESTNPTAEPVSDEVEWQRLKPFLQIWLDAVRDPQWTNDGVEVESEGIRLGMKPRLSIDSYHPKNLLRLLDYPVDFYNLVLDIPDQLWQQLAFNSSAKFIFMHNLGLPRAGVSVAKEPGLVQAVFDWGERIKARAGRLGIDESRLVLDVGLGFGKNPEQNWQIIKNIQYFKAWQVPILVGHSRKSYLQTVTDQAPSERDLETAILSSWLADQGVDYLRIHNPAGSVRALNIQQVLRR